MITITYSVEGGVGVVTSITVEIANMPPEPPEKGDSLEIAIWWAMKNGFTLVEHPREGVCTCTIPG